MKSNANTLLLIGGPAAGKTHYGGQLLGRLQEGTGEIKMGRAAENLAPFEEVLNRLGQGLAASHTSTQAYHEVCLPVELPAKGSMDLIWPDYGGEQIRQMVEQRQISQAWHRRIKQSGGWLLFIRLDQTRAYEDILSRPWKEMIAAPAEENGDDYKWSDQAVYVELLQLLLYAKGVGTVKRVKTPALAIVLSCWDEMDEADAGLPPFDLLRQRMPLFADFVSSTWAEEYVSYLGLSSLGKALRADHSDEEYLDFGPERFGYVVLPDGERAMDLTIPILTLMQRVP